MKIKSVHVFIAMVITYIASRILGDVFVTWPYLDIPFHILGGFLAALLGLTLWKELVERKKIKNVPPLAVAIGIIAFTALIAVLWECHEFLLDEWHARQGMIFNWMQPSNADTMKDLANGLFGACLCVLGFHKQLD